MESKIKATEEQRAYAWLLDWGMKIGLAMLVVTFALYLTGAMKPYVPVADLVAEEIAAIVPIPENVVDDATFDVWAEIRPMLEEAVGRALDAAVFFGTNKPASWPTAIVPAAVAAGNVYARGTNNAAAGGVGVRPAPQQRVHRHGGQAQGQEGQEGLGGHAQGGRHLSGPSAAGSAIPAATGTAAAPGAHAR